MKNKILYIFLISLSLILSKNRVAFIANVNGYVEILSDSKNVPALEAVNGRYLYEGDIIRTFKNSNCIIMFDDQTSIFALDSYSEVIIKKLEKGIKKINFNYGELYIENRSKKTPLFVFTRSSQILSLESASFIKSLTNRDDEVFCIDNKIELYNKKSNLEVAIYDNNKVLSILDGKVELKKSELNFISRDLSGIIKIAQQNIKAPLAEFVYEKGDLVPNYSVNSYLNTYKPIPKKPYRIFAGGGVSHLNGNFYGKVTLNTIYDNNNLSFNIEIDQYFPFDNSPEINVWDKSSKILSKIKYLNYKTDSESVLLNSGALSDITFGHGLILKRYSNRYNYPIRNNYGVNFKYQNKDFIDFQLFISDLNNLSDNGAVVGVHSSLFISKYIPLRIGFGLISDLNQFVNIKDNYEVSLDSRSVNSIQIDLSYNLMSKKGFNIDLISEIGAIVFPQKHFYKRYDSSGNNDLASGLKNKEGSWGGLIGVEGGFQDFIKLKTHFHYNEPLFYPAFFNNTYEFERARMLG